MKNACSGGVMHLVSSVSSYRATDQSVLSDRALRAVHFHCVRSAPELSAGGERKRALHVT